MSRAARLHTATRPSSSSPSAVGAPAGGRGRRERPEAASSLGKNASNSSTAGQSRGERRDEAWRLRRRLWEISSLPAVRACGRVSRVEGGGATLRITDGDERVAGLAGLVSCGSVWACPCCARKIAQKRAEEIKTVVDGVFAAGGGVAMVTLTLRHHRGHRLDDSWDVARYGWSRVTSGRGYAVEVTMFGLMGWASVVECTHGCEHGWHPHLHVLVFTDTPISVEMAEGLGLRWWQRWERALGRRGFSALMDRGGLDVRLVSPDDSSGALGQYLSKVAHEVTGGHTKNGRGGNRTPFQILRDGLETGLADDIELWWEYEQASRGRKQLTWSKGIRERFGVGVEQSDEEIAEEAPGGDDLIVLPAETWRVVRDRAEDLLATAERDGASGAVRWLDERHLDWLPAGPPGVGRGS